MVAIIWTIFFYKPLAEILQEEKRKIGWVTIDIVLVIVLNHIILYKN